MEAARDDLAEAVDAAVTSMAESAAKTCRDYAQRIEQLEAELARKQGSQSHSVPLGQWRQCKVVTADFEKGTATFEIPPGYGIGSRIDVRIYEHHGRRSLTGQG